MKTAASASASAVVIATAIALACSFSGCAGCGGCGKKQEEPHDDAFQPAIAPTISIVPKALDAGPRDGGPKSTVTPSEERDMRIHLDPELCSEGAKRVNALHGRAATDPVAVNIVSTCLKYGNTAWYRCVITASSAEVADTCGRRFLVPPEDLPQ